MKYISLSNSNEQAIVGDNDYEWISQWIWQLSDEGYAVRYQCDLATKKQVLILMHYEIKKKMFRDRWKR